MRIANRIRNGMCSTMLFILFQWYVTSFYYQYTYVFLANPQMKASIVMMCMVIPGQAVFLGVIYALGSGHQDLSAIFITLYMLSSLLQVREECFALEQSLKYY